MRRSARGALVAVGCLVLVLSLALVGCDSNARRIREINEVLATPAAERTRLTAKIDAIEIRDGDCIISSLPEGISIETVVIVPCSGTWQYRVLNSFLVAGGERYPGEDVFEQRAYEKCDRRYSFILFPLSESWSFGDRTVNCLQESFGLSIADPGKLDRLVNSESLSYGECYEGAPETGDLMVELSSSNEPKKAVTGDPATSYPPAWSLGASATVVSTAYRRASGCRSSTSVNWTAWSTQNR